MAVPSGCLAADFPEAFDVAVADGLACGVSLAAVGFACWADGMRLTCFRAIGLRCGAWAFFECAAGFELAFFGCTFCDAAAGFLLAFFSGVFRTIFRFLVGSLRGLSAFCCLAGALGCLLCARFTGAGLRASLAPALAVGWPAEATGLALGRWPL